MNHTVSKHVCGVAFVLSPLMFARDHTSIEAIFPKINCEWNLGLSSEKARARARPDLDRFARNCEQLWSHPSIANRIEIATSTSRRSSRSRSRSRGRHVHAWCQLQAVLVFEFEKARHSLVYETEF